MATTSNEVRQAIVRAFHVEGLSYSDIASVLGVGEATVSRVLRLYRETGSVEPRVPGGGWVSPIHGVVADELVAIVADLPDATIAEMTDELIERCDISTSPAAVHRALHRMGFTRKKSPLSR